MSNAPDDSIVHKFDTFTSPRLWQARPRAQRRGGAAGLLYRRCAGLFGVHAIQQMVNRHDSRPDGCAAVPAPVPAPPQPYRAQPRRCGRRRDAAPSVARAARQGRQYRRTLMSTAAPPPFDGDIAIAGSCGSPAYAPSCQTMRHRISVEGRFVNVMMTWARCLAVSVKRLTRRNAHGRDSWPE